MSIGGSDAPHLPFPVNEAATASHNPHIFSELDSVVNLPPNPHASSRHSVASNFSNTPTSPTANEDNIKVLIIGTSLSKNFILVDVGDTDY